MPRGCIVFVAATAAGYALAILGYLVWSHFNTDREGAVAMGVIFTLGPAFALACGVTAALVAAGRKG